MRLRFSAASAGWLVAAALLLATGWAIGSRLGASGLERVAPDGSLMEVHLDDGSVYLGAVDASEDGWILSDPAIVVPEGAEGPETSYAVQPLSGDPYGIGGPILIPRDRVLFLGGVRAGSGIEAAYQTAMSGGGETPPPSPG